MEDSPLLMSTRASAVRPAKARQMWSSTFTILRADRASCSFAALFRSAPAWSSRLLNVNQINMNEINTNKKCCILPLRAPAWTWFTTNQCE